VRYLKSDRRERYRLRYRDTRYYRDTGNALRNSNFFRYRQSRTLVSLKCVWTLNCLYSRLLCILYMKCAPASVNITRSQVVARIAYRTSSLHFWGHVTSSVTWPFDTPYAISHWWSFVLTKPLLLTVSEIFNVECNAIIDMTMIRPLNKGQGHSFWYQSISHIRLSIGCQ